MLKLMGKKILTILRSKVLFILTFDACIKERSGSVVKCLTQDQRAVGWSLTGIFAVCPGARYVNPSLVLVQPVPA